MKPRRAGRFAICINNGGYVDDLKTRTIYQVLSDPSAARSNYLRVIDETGEDYLYPAAYFVLIDVPREAKQAFSFSRLSSKSKGGVKKTRRTSSGEHKFVA